MKYNLTLLFIVYVSFLFSQTELYPIGDDASINFNISDNPNGDKGILFEAKPLVRYSFYNNIKERLLTSAFKRASTSYVLFSPHLRMYNENSAPIKMPSYKIALGFQQVWKLNTNQKNNHSMLIAALENGHYSNGQSGCAFSEGNKDNTVPCSTIYNTVINNQNINLSNLLNRNNGHFQTNYSTFFLNHRITKKENNVALQSISYSFGYTLYHKKMLAFFNIGGYSDNDIQIYGKHRFHFDAEYSFKLYKSFFGVFHQKLNVISGAHKSITNYRSETSFSVFPFKITNNFGFKMGYNFGHDDYNLRFVDNVNQFTLGIVFSPFGIFSFNNS